VQIILPLNSLYPTDYLAQLIILLLVVPMINYLSYVPISVDVRHGPVRMEGPTCISVGKLARLLAMILHGRVVNYKGMQVVIYYDITPLCRCEQKQH